jgi:trimethylamine--corrinoid protein Co-methyltransferase
MNDGQTGRRSGGRADRVAKRALPPAVNPCPPGQRGGQYRPLSEADMQAIYMTALRLLSDLGVGEHRLAREQADARDKRSAQRGRSGRNRCLRLRLRLRR